MAKQTYKKGLKYTKRDRALIR